MKIILILTIGGVMSCGERGVKRQNNESAQIVERLSLPDKFIPVDTAFSILPGEELTVKWDFGNEGLGGRWDLYSGKFPDNIEDAILLAKDNPANLQQLTIDRALLGEEPRYLFAVLHHSNGSYIYFIQEPVKAESGGP